MCQKKYFEKRLLMLCQKEADGILSGGDEVELENLKTKYPERIGHILGKGSPLIQFKNELVLVSEE